MSAAQLGRLLQHVREQPLPITPRQPSGRSPDRRIVAGGVGYRARVVRGWESRATRPPGRRVGFAVSVALSSLLVAGCGDPGPTTPAIGLSTADGTLQLRSVLCKDERVEYVEIGHGDSQYADAQWRLTPEETTGGEFTIELADPVGWTVEGDGRAGLSAPRFPLAVRVQTPEGLASTVLVAPPAGDQVAVTGESLIEGSSASMSSEAFVAAGRADCG